MAFTQRDLIGRRDGSTSNQFSLSNCVASEGISIGSTPRVEKKRTTGRTTLMRAVQNLAPGERYEIMLNGEGQPTFGPVSKLSQVLGVEARTIPVSCRTWKDVQMYVKDDLYSRILV